ncbi:methyltransferase family protein [Shimazuella alba]|uniref:Isoprenylcysteine carboxylmethyltransferase family protein n=1 Tax=Shimazuella alba TaxID=2690964 RepID=A0A6I4VZ54_9BACL|nr:isoprenylcysteine carboxylmethyltransferase family protein [Shimazuella alba]MXQ55818.1 isoprenylcysteine carboxylmethyltransferase family protein [Shimazuella alba]
MKKEVSLSSFLISLTLPTTMTVIVPSIILYFFDENNFSFGLHAWLGMLILITGLSLVTITIGLFKRIGKGTLNPLDPPKKLVIAGPYRYVRNPMITGVLLVQLGESIMFTSFELLIWFFGFWMANQIYFIWKEEPQLLKRFGPDYQEYRENVPKWVPRFSPWLKDKK